MITSINEFRKIYEATKADRIYMLRQEIVQLKRQLQQLFSDQDLEAGQKGDQWNDDDGNRYGAQMNDVQEQIDAKEEQLQRLLQPHVERPEIALSRILRKQLHAIQQHIAKYKPTWTEMNLSDEDIAKTFKDRFGITKESPETIIAALKYLKLL